MTKVLPVLVFVILSIATVFLSGLFKIKEVQLFQNQNCVDQKVIAQDFLGKYIFLINEDQVKKKFRDKYPCIDQVTLKKVLPNNIVVEISTQNPIVKIEGANLYVTKSGFVTENSKFANLPTIFLPQNVWAEKGKKLTDTNVVFALDLISILAKSDFSVANVRFLDQDIAVYNHAGTVALFLAKKSPVLQVDSLQQVLAQARIDAGKIAKIDLRFDKPIVALK